MHTEHLQNVHPVRVLAGWLVSVAVTAVVVFVLIAGGMMGVEPGHDAAWAVGSVALGFLVGGWFTGYRTVEAPILHGIAMGVTSLVVWVLVNLVVALGFGWSEWTGLSPNATIVVLLVLMAAAVAGCVFGTQRARARARDLAGPGAGVPDGDSE